MSLAKFIFITFGFIAIILSCSYQQKNKEVSNALTPKQIQDTLEAANKLFILQEKDRISNYCSHLPYNFKQTGTGLLYFVKEIKNTPSPKSEQWVKVTYTVSLLNGDVCYTTNNNKPEQFKVDHDDVEKGIHEGIKLMHLGEKARLIIPSHLAHGLLGDLNKIPPRNTVIYDIKLIAIE